jgi:ribosomal protein L40E
MSRERSRAEQAPAVAQIQPEAVTAAAGAGSCRSCGLSISASARFCRRCGARQDA